MRILLQSMRPYLRPAAAGASQAIAVDFALDASFRLRLAGVTPLAAKMLPPAARKQFRSVASTLGKYPYAVRNMQYGDAMKEGGGNVYLLYSDAGADPMWQPGGYDPCLELASVARDTFTPRKLGEEVAREHNVMRRLRGVSNRYARMSRLGKEHKQRTKCLKGGGANCDDVKKKKSSCDKAGYKGKVSKACQAFDKRRKFHPRKGFVLVK